MADSSYLENGLSEEETVPKEGIQGSRTVSPRRLVSILDKPMIGSSNNDHLQPILIADSSIITLLIRQNYLQGKVIVSIP